MLTILAAVIPIVASLYVASSMLLEYAHRDHTARVFARVSAREAAERELVPVGHPDFNRLTAEIIARRMMLLEANGVDPKTGTWDAWDETSKPQPMPRIELRRQWALLFGSAAGVVLLAMDLL